MPDDKRFVPDFQLVVDGQAADPELKGSIVGIRVTDDMDKASRFWLHLSDVGRKWTRQKKFKPGTAIEIKLGYQGQLKSVCKGEVSNIEIVLTADGPSRLVVAGVDKGHGFDKGTVTKTYKNVKDSDLATQIARRHNLSAEVEDSKVVHDYVIQNNLSDYDFLMQRAALAGFRVYVDDRKLLFKKPKLGDPPAAKLVWRENIGRLIQEVNTFDQVSKITTSGWDPKNAREMTGPGKTGDEYGKQGGTVTGAQLVKQMFGDIEQVVTLATGEKSLLEAVAKSEYNQRAGAFVHAEARVTGDPAIRAGSVVEVEKAGKRVDGQYYVVSTDHLFFVDTGYATEFRAKRYTIKKGSAPVKNLAKFAQAVQQAAEKAQQIAQNIQNAAAWALKAAREAAKRASQALEAAKQVWQDVKDALEQVKQGAGDVAQAALKSVESKLAGLKDYVAQADAKVAEAAQEAVNATQEVAREALTKAHEAAAQVAEIAGQAIRHAADAYDAVKAAALDAVHTVGDQLSQAVQGLKSSARVAAETALEAGKAGMTLAQAAIAKGKSAIEMCAASAAAAAKSLIDGLGSDLGQVIDAVKSSGDAAGKSIGSAIAAGAQNVLDAAKDAIHQAQDAIAKAKEAVQNAADTIKKNVADKLKDLVDQAKGMVDEVKKTVDEYKEKFEEYRKQIEDAIDQYGGKWIKAGVYIGEHGENAFKAGKSCFEHIKSGLALLKEKKWEDAGKEVDPAQQDFETAKSEVQLCIDKLEEVEKDLPDSVKQSLRTVIDNVRKMLPEGESSLTKFIEAVKAKVGQLAAKAKEACEKAKKIYDQVKAGYDEYKQQFEQLKEFYEAAKEAVQSGEKAWAGGKDGIAKCKEALDLASKRDGEAAKKGGEEAKAELEQAKQDEEDCAEKAKAAYDMLPEQVKHALEQLVEKLQGLMGNAESTLGKTLAALERKPGEPAEGGAFEEAQAAQKESEQLFAKGWDEGKKHLENVAAEMKKTISEAIDRLLKKIEEEVMKVAEQVLEKALQTAAASWDLKETDSATEAGATRQLEAAMQRALDDAKEELKRLGEDFKAAAEGAGADMLTHLATGTDAVTGSADQSVAASEEVQNNPVRKADEHSKAAEAQHDELARGHDENKDKHEEQTKKFLSSLKDQYGKVHEMGQKMQGPLAEAVQKSGVSIDKSAGIQMSQARGALDQIASAYAQAKSGYDEAEQHRGSLQNLVSRMPELREKVDQAFTQLKSACDEGSKASDEAKKTVKEHEKEIAAEAEKATEEAAKAVKRAEAALAEAKKRIEQNKALFRGMPMRKGAAEAIDAASAAARSATGAAESAKNSGAEAKESATGACKVPDDERVKEAVLAAIGELEKAAKKAEDTAEKAQKAVDSAAQGDAAEAKKNAGAAQSSQQATASAAGSASASAKQSQQTAAQAAGRKEPPKEEKGGEEKGPAGATGAGQPRKPAGAAETAAAGAPQAAPSAGQAQAPAGAAQTPAAAAGPAAGTKPPGTAPSVPGVPEISGAGIVSQAQGAPGQAAAVAPPATPEVPGAGIAAQAQGAAGQAQGVAGGPPPVPSAPGFVETAQSAAAGPGEVAKKAGAAGAPDAASDIATGIGAAAGAAGIAAAAAAATQTAEARPEATVVSAATDAVGKATPGAAHDVADTAHDVSARVAKGKEVGDAAKDTAQQKVEVAALGTKPAAGLEQARGLEEKLARKLEGVESAKDTAEKADQGDDSADIEE